jgi:hypothetical protein
MEKGDRVRFSDKAKRAHINGGKDRCGTFMGLEKGFYIKVLWDGNTSVGTGFHPDFIEPDSAQSNGNSRP